MKFIVSYLQFINSLEGLGMFFSSAALIRRLRRYDATLPLFKKRHSMVNVFCLFPLGSALDECSTLKAQLSQCSLSHKLHQLVTEDFCLLIGAIEVTKETLWSDAEIRKRSAAFFLGGNSFAVSAVKGNLMKSSDIRCNVKDSST